MRFFFVGVVLNLIFKRASIGRDSPCDVGLHHYSMINENNKAIDLLYDLHLDVHLDMVVMSYFRCAYITKTFCNLIECPIGHPPSPLGL